MRKLILLLLVLFYSPAYAGCSCSNNALLKIVYLDSMGSSQIAHLLVDKWVHQPAGKDTRALLEEQLRNGASFEIFHASNTISFNIHGHVVASAPFAVRTGKQLSLASIPGVKIEKAWLLKAGCDALPPSIRPENFDSVAYTDPVKIEKLHDEKDGTHYRLYYRKGSRLIWLSYKPELDKQCDRSSASRSIVKPSPKKFPVSFVFASEGDKSCALHALHLETGEIHVVFKPDSCPKKIYRNGPGGLILVYPKGIRVLKLKSKVLASQMIALPTPAPPRDYSTAKLEDIGSDSNGVLTIDMRSWGPADDTHAIIYQLISGNWSLAREADCGKWSYEDCSVKSLGGVPSGFVSPEQMSPWHETQRQNPYIRSLTFQETKGSGDSRQYANAILRFTTRDGQGVLSIRVFASSHYENVWYPSQAQYMSPGKSAEQLISEQSSLQLAGKYLVVFRNWMKGYFILDLTTGKRINLNQDIIGVWLYQ